jgi:arylsulfatase A-like enzyme
MSENIPFSMLFLGAAALAAGCGQHSAGPESSPPNIVLIMTDDQGWAQLGMRGDDALQTPHIDRLAAQSVDFTRFYVSPVCAPTRASLMTGRYNYRTGVVDTYMGRAMMAPDETTIAEMLSDAGYRTGVFGKWHLGDNYPMRAMDQGFDETLLHRGGGIGQPSDPPGSDYFDPVLFHNGVEKRYEGYCTDVYFDAALEFISAADGRPFFVYIPTNAPHSPYLVPDSYREPYAAQGLDDKDARIYGMITNIDDNAGRLMEHLDELGISDNTILIFMTDNGPTTQRYTAGLRDQKASVYEGGIRVPFFVRWPARLEPKQVETIAAHIDVPPTLLDAAGAAAPRGVRMDGISLLPLLEGDRPADWPERTIHIQSHRGDKPERYRNFAAVAARYKLVQPLSFQRPAPADAWLELYDVEADPGERNDLSEELPEVVAAMKRGYEAWFDDVTSGRSFEAQRIYLGTEHENPVTLTRQDWRVTGPDGWGEGALGHWEVDVREAGVYGIRLDFPPPERFTYAARASGGRAEIEVAGVTLESGVPRGADSVTFESVELPAGPTALRARTVSGGKTEGVWFVHVTKQ